MPSTPKVRRRNRSKYAIMDKHNGKSKKRSSTCLPIGNDTRPDSVGVTESPPKRRKADLSCSDELSSPKDTANAIVHVHADPKPEKFEFRVVDAFPNDTTDKVVFISFLNRRDHGWILRIIDNVLCCCLVKTEEDIVVLEEYVRDKNLSTRKQHSTEVMKIERQLDDSKKNAANDADEAKRQLEDSKEKADKAASDAKWNFDQRLEAKEKEIVELGKSQQYAESRLCERNNKLKNLQTVYATLKKDSDEFEARKREGTLGELSVMVNEILVNKIKDENKPVRDAITSYQLSNPGDKDKFDRLESLMKLSEFKDIQKKSTSQKSEDSLVLHYYKLLKLCNEIKGNRNETHHAVYAVALDFATDKAKNIVKQKFNGNQHIQGKLTGKGPNTVLNVARSKLEKKKVY